jgi:hypothetical protein
MMIKLLGQCRRLVSSTQYLRSLGIKISTTFPYLSNKGNRSSALVPAKSTFVISEQQRKPTTKTHSPPSPES